MLETFDNRVERLGRRILSEISTARVPSVIFDYSGRRLCSIDGGYRKLLGHLESHFVFLCDLSEVGCEKYN